MINTIDWVKVNGMLPTIVQDRQSKEVLMFAYSTKESLEQTIKDEKLCFYSRSKKRLWTKGETSGNWLYLKGMKIDCDKDSLIIFADAAGVTCHKETVSCFNNESLSFLNSLELIIEARSKGVKTESYVNSLINNGISRVAQKVGEEAVEVAIAATLEDKKEVLNESSDLLFHLIILLKLNNLSLVDIAKELENRHFKN